MTRSLIIVFCLVFCAGIVWGACGTYESELVIGFEEAYDTDTGFYAKPIFEPIKIVCVDLDAPEGMHWENRDNAYWLGQLFAPWEIKRFEEENPTFASFGPTEQDTPLFIINDPTLQMAPLYTGPIDVNFMDEYGAIVLKAVWNPVTKELTIGGGVK
jgi:hypothetical protein